MNISRIIVNTTVSIAKSPTEESFLQIHLGLKKKKRNFPGGPVVKTLHFYCRGHGFDPGRASLVAQMVKNLPAMPETWVQSLGGEDPLKKGMATHSSILAWRTPWTEEPGGLQYGGWQRGGHS